MPSSPRTPTSSAADGDRLDDRSRRHARRPQPPRRVVASVAGRRAVPGHPLDEHAVAARRCAPPATRGPGRRRRARSRCERSRFTAAGTGSSPSRARAGPRRVREGVHARQAGRLRPASSVRANAASSSAGKPTITSAVTFRPGDARAAPRRSAPRSARRSRAGASPAARASSPDCIGTCRCGSAAGVSASAATTAASRWSTSIDDSRSALDARHRADGTDHVGQPRARRRGRGRC